jgi:hypothetical protein
LNVIDPKSAGNVGDLLCLHRFFFLLLLFFLSFFRQKFIQHISRRLLNGAAKFVQSIPIFLAYLVPLDVDVVPNKFDQFLFGE